MMPFHLWRGRSGRRYLASVHPAADPPDAAQNSVVLFVAVENGVRSIAGALSFGALDASAAGRLRRAMLAAAPHELHVHLLARTEAERAAMVRDLSPEKRRAEARREG